MPWTFPSEIQGWLTEDEGRLLADLARLKRVLEVGSYHGRSSVCMAQTASWLVSVDHHRDDDKNRLDSLDYLTANLKRYGVLDRTIVVLGRSAEVAPFLRTGSFDLVFIDAGHQAADLWSDIVYCSRLAAGGATWAFHDYGNPDFPDVRPVVDAFADQHLARIAVTFHTAWFKT